MGMLLRRPGHPNVLTMKIAEPRDWFDPVCRKLRPRRGTAVESYAAAGSVFAERRPDTYRTPSASVCSSCIVPAGTLQESPGA